MRAPVIAFLCTLLSSCGGSSPYQDGVFTGPETSYSVAAPGAEWRSLEVESQNDLAFYDEARDAIIQSNSTCDPSQDIPLLALTNHLLFGFTARELLSQELQPMDAREALYTHLKAKLDGVPRELLLVVLKKDGCVYDFALVAPPGSRFEGALPDFERFVGDFRAGGDSR